LKANVSLIASDLSRAREQAEAAFMDFYGEQSFEVVEEEAESHTVVQFEQGDEHVVSWRCDFTAEGRGE
jgi:hypothetical protein